MADLLEIPRRGIAKQSNLYHKLKMGHIPSELIKAYVKAKENKEQIPARCKKLFGELEHKENGVLIKGEYSKMYNRSGYLFFLDAPFQIGNQCCLIMKKEPAHRYTRQTGKKPMTAQMASESKLRTNKWLTNGCNGFEMKSPISNPMAFWTEQDVLLYIKEFNLPICSVYGDIVPENREDGQITLADMDKELFELEVPTLKTTGCDRTGCAFCLFGIHLEKSPNRLELMKETHPKLYEYVMKPEADGGLGYKDKIDWVNEHSKLNIKY